MERLLVLLALVASPALAQNEAQKPPAQPATQARSAAAGGSAVPREDPSEARRLFRELDRNGDGHLSGDELWSERGQDANWAAIDRNRDGRITPEEFTVLRR